MTADYLVTIDVPLTVRVENADDIEQARSMALEWLAEANLVELLDETPFYVGFYDDEPTAIVDPFYGHICEEIDCLSPRTAGSLYCDDHNGLVSEGEQAG